MNHDCYAHYAEASTLKMLLALSALAMSLVAVARFILLVHIDIEFEFETRLSIKVNSRYTLLRHLSVSNLQQLQ